MIDVREINETIDQLRREGTTVAQAQKLALMYIARDHMLEDDAQDAETENEQDHAARYARARMIDHIVPEHTENDFLRACSGMHIDDVLNVLNEHMDAIKMLYPKEYEKIIRMLDDLR